MPAHPGPEHFLPLTPMDFEVLLALGDGPLHGYGIMKSVAEQSGGTLQPEIGSLYRMIGRLIASGLIAEAQHGRPGDGRGRARRHYELTPLGREVARAESHRLQQALAVAQAKQLGVGPAEVG